MCSPLNRTTHNHSVVSVTIDAHVFWKSSDPKRGFNSHLLIDPCGDIVSNYHKIHLFVSLDPSSHGYLIEHL